MKGYFVTEDQIYSLKERLELPNLRRPYTGKNKKMINAITTTFQKDVMNQLEAWIKQISK